MNPLAQQVPGTGGASPVGERGYVSNTVYYASLWPVGFETDGACPGSHQFGRARLPVDKAWVYGEAMDTFPPQEAGAELVADIVSPVDYGDGVASRCQAQGSVITGRAGTHHDYIVQVSMTSRTPHQTIGAARLYYHSSASAKDDWTGSRPDSFDELLAGMRRPVPCLPPNRVRSLPLRCCRSTHMKVVEPSAERDARIQGPAPPGASLTSLRGGV